jgi:hypothetical protein
MQTIDGKRVLFDVSDIGEFRAVWPCSGLPDSPLWFEFDWRGDLVDTNAPEDCDGGAINALVDDARAFISSTGAILPEWISK